MSVKRDKIIEYLNEYLKRRDKKLKGKIKNYCTHANIKNFDDVIGIESSFISPSGTTNWICEKCGLQIYHLDKKGEKRKFEYFFKNPKKFKKQEKKFQKLLKKAGFL